MVMNTNLAKKYTITKRKLKNTQSSTKYAYHTPGNIRLDSIRNNIPDYHTATITIDESINLPNPGTYNIKIRIEKDWYFGVVFLSHSTDLENKRMIKVFIKNCLDKPTNENIIIAWCLNKKNYYWR
jgi:FAD synthase